MIASPFFPFDDRMNIQIVSGKISDKNVSKDVGKQSWAAPAAGSDDC
jgi:hypothetical protein